MNAFPELSRPSWLRYGAAGFAAVGALALTRSFWGLFQGIPYMLAFMALFFAGSFGGAGPSVLVVVTCAAGAWILFPASGDVPMALDHAEVLRTVLFVAVGGAASGLFGQLWKSKRSRGALLAQLQAEWSASDRARRRLEETLESVGDGYCAISPESQFTYVNDEAARLLGRSREALIGASALDVTLLPEGVIDSLRSVRASGTRQWRDASFGTDGRCIDVRIQTSEQGLTMLLRDVTAARDADAAKRRLAAIVESSEDAIVGKTLDGLISAWNPAAERLYGYTAAEVLGKPISTLMPVERRSEMAEILGRIRRGERIEHFETTRVTKAGMPVQVSVSVSPIKDAAGNVIGAAKIARDIGERKKAEEERERLLNEARDAARTREEFLSIAGHELRTPLTALQLQLHTLRRRMDEGQTEGASQVLEKIRQQFGRLTQLTEELLDVTRIASGRLVLEPQEMELGELVREVTDRYHDIARRTGAEIRVDASERVTGLWDRSRIDQVVTNLLSNAVKFGQGRPIDVRVERHDGGARLIVEDRGIGISPEDQAKIFERFERAVSRRSYGGMGLGLWIARQIVEAHGGEILVTSRTGEGSRFHVELPSGARATGPEAVSVAASRMTAAPLSATTSAPAIATVAPALPATIPAANSATTSAASPATTSAANSARTSAAIAATTSAALTAPAESAIPPSPSATAPVTTP